MEREGLPPIDKSARPQEAANFIPLVGDKKLQAASLPFSPFSASLPGATQALQVLNDQRVGCLHRSGQRRAGHENGY